MTDRPHAAVGPVGRTPAPPYPLPAGAGAGGHPAPEPPLMVVGGETVTVSGLSVVAPVGVGSAAAGLMEHAGREIAAAVGEVWPGEPVRLGPARTGGRTVVCRVAVGGRVDVCATYRFVPSLTALPAGEHGRLPELLAVQQPLVADLLAGEAAQIELLSRYGRVPVAAPVGISGGVLFTRWVAGPTLADRLLGAPQDSGQLLAGLLAVLEGLHTDPPGELRRAARRASRQVPTVLARALGLGSYQWLAGINSGLVAADTAEELRRAGLRLVGRLGQLAHCYAADLTGGVCFGALSPQHVIYPDRSIRPVLVSPALSTGGQAADVGMLLGRLHLLGIGAPAPAPTTAGIADGVRAWLGQLTAGRRPGWAAAVLTVWAADVLATLAGWMCLPPGLLPLLPGAVLSAGRRAAGVLAAVDAATAALADGDVDAALRIALDGLPSPSPSPEPVAARAGAPPGPLEPHPHRTRLAHDCSPFPEGARP
jgi:hypothetical protein